MGSQPKRQLYVTGSRSRSPPRRYTGGRRYCCLIQVDLDR